MTPISSLNCPRMFSLQKKGELFLSMIALTYTIHSTYRYYNVDLCCRFLRRIPRNLMPVQIIGQSIAQQHHPTANDLLHNGVKTSIKLHFVLHSPRELYKLSREIVRLQEIKCDFKKNLIPLCHGCSSVERATFERSFQTHDRATDPDPKSHEFVPNF